MRELGLPASGPKQTGSANGAGRITVKTHTFQSTTAGDVKGTRKLIAMGEFKGPGGGDDAANDAEFAAFDAAVVDVTAWVLNPPVESSADGSYPQAAIDAAKTPVAAYSVNNFDAWLYGVSLKASGKVRQIATQGEVDDHMLSIGRQSTDLDAMDAKQLAKSLNGLRAAMAAGMSFGPSNEAKIASKVAQAIEKGALVERDGTLIVK